MCDSSSSTVTSGSPRSTKTINPDLCPMSSKEDSMHDTGKNPNSDAAAPGAKQNQVGTVMLFGVPIVSLVMDGKERLCLAQISSTLLKDFSYNEIHNRRVALGINCVQCTPVQLEILRRAGAMPVTSRRCGMITRREAERLCKSFLGDHAPPQLPENFAFDVYHECGWGCRGSFVPSRYNSSRAKCIRCSFCQLFFSPNKFIFHSHRLPESRYVQPDAANFNSWRRHMKLCGDPPEEANSSNSVSDMATAQIVHAWEDVKAMFNGGTRKRLLAATTAPTNHSSAGRHSSSSHGHSGGSGKGSANSRSQSHGENHCNGGNSGNTGHSRNGGSHPTKKESGSATAPSNASQHGANYNHDAPNANNFLHQSQNLFLNSPNPLLSPSGRLESIWNPALSAAPGAAGQGSRPCSIPGSPPFPALPFHPLSIPWLRRPLFPFSHPFGPTLLNDPGCTAPADKLVNLAVARQNQSAFKPVSRSVEPLFNWLNGNNLGGGAGAINLGHSGATAVSLPEDLSVNSCGHGGTPATNTSGSTPTVPPSNPHFNVNNNVGGGSSFNLAKHLESTSNSEKPSRLNNNNNNNSPASKNHQIQILSAHQNESDDEENVDIESTVETEECSSTSSVWVSSTTAYSAGRTGSATPRLTSPYNLGHNNNNNNNNSIVELRRRKRLAPCYSSGEDMDEHDSDNQEDSPNDHYDETGCSPGERERNGNKRKRFWISKISDDEDAKVELSNKGNPKVENNKLHGSSAGRVLLEFTRD